MNDADVESVDEQNDGGSLEGSSESDFVHVAVDAECDSTVVHAVASNAWFGIRLLKDRRCFWSGVVGRGGCCRVR